MEQAEVGSVCLAAHKRRFPASECCGREQAATPPQPPLPQIPAEEEPQMKQRKKEQEQEENLVQDTERSLLDFCDELLIEIFQYLDTSSIMAVMHCSPRLENLLLDHRFYHHIDLSNGPLPMGILEEILGRATEKTHTIKICGPPSSQHVAGEFRQFTQTLSSVFPKVVQLKVLELQGVSLDFEYIHISEFPSTLTRLKLKDCSVKVGNSPKSIFHSIELHLVHLEDLSIEDNSWFEPYYIMVLSKLPSLRRLSLKGCQTLCKFVPYGSMAARFGFQKLESLDLRLTPINNSDLQCFSAIENLKELLLESPQILPSKQAVAEKTTNGNATDEAASPQPDSMKVLNDDEPSTSRAAMEHLRACKIAFNLDNCNERKEEQSPVPVEPLSNSQDLQVKRIRAPSESEDDDTSSTSATSASSSDKSEVSSPPSNGHNGAAPLSSPVLVIALRGMGADMPPRPPAADGDNPEDPGQDPGLDPRPTPRAYIYMPDAIETSQQQRNIVAVIEQRAQQLGRMRGNNPACSHFLPRRDHVIYQQRSPAMNVLMPTRRYRTHPRPNYDQVVQHPMFWNMLDPLDRDYARRLRHRPTACQTSPQYYVTDRAMYSFGRASRPVQPDVVWIRNINRSPDNRLERLSLRNYHLITNHTLEHLVQCSPNLVYIDVSGTSITLPAIRRFKNSKPECEVVADHLEEYEKLADQEPQEEDATVVLPSQEDPQHDQQPPKSPPPSQELVAP
ncbi:uncharacterized protein LOC6554123 [Drosophila erecta]|uniref:GG12087 n=1 Tax=Drosophila erecta TaxID=7220 RepID=B3P5W5_DROER|nr:uncharacterized protein LOC6554123 [Drosophila erecta]EDV53365.1 uncharacterized protein Dere_GG12087 [Drosophila erecta]